MLLSLEIQMPKTEEKTFGFKLGSNSRELQKLTVIEHIKRV